MKYLSTLTPAETQIILTGDKTPVSELLKLTFMDLLLKEVLSIHEVERKPSSRDPIRVYKYVMIGTNYRNYDVSPHEAVFFSFFKRNRNASVLFRNLVKIAYQNARSERSYYRLLTTNPHLRASISTSLFQIFFAGFSYTRKGIIMKEEIQKEISNAEKTISDCMATDRKRGLEILKGLGGNIFLLKTLEFEILKEFDQEIFEQVTKKNTGTGCGTGCWAGYGAYSDAFDSSCSSDSGSGCGGGDSGCSGGGSGCGSGCSGCGGCGGD